MNEKEDLLNQLEAFIQTELWKPGYYFRDREITRMDIECNENFPDKNTTLRGRCKEVFGEYPFERCAWYTESEWEGFTLGQKICIMKADGISDDILTKMKWDAILYGEGFDAYKKFARDNNWKTFADIEKQIKSFIQKWREK